MSDGVKNRLLFAPSDCEPSVFAVGLEAFWCLIQCGVFTAGVLRVWLLSFVQAWEGEVWDLVHRRAPRKVCLSSLLRIQDRV